MSRAGFAIAIAVVACGAALGCATPNRVSYAAINAPPRPFVRRTADEVEVTVGKPPARPAVDVGMFEVSEGTNDDGSRKSVRAMIATLREHAALRGCDAVQVLNVDSVGRDGWRVVRGVCEVYTDPPAQPAAGHAPTPPPALPGEGTSCSVETGGDLAVPSCPAPLVCSNGACASPYR
jgi:hypothetical protein